MVATQLIRSVAATAAKYRAVRSTRRRVRVTPKMCLVLEEADHSSLRLERLEHQRLSRRLELVRQTLFVADEIIEKTFSSDRPVRRSRSNCPVLSCQLSVHFSEGQILRDLPSSVRCFSDPSGTGFARPLSPKRRRSLRTSQTLRGLRDLRAMLFPFPAERC